jgi:hypothetical protein
MKRFLLASIVVYVVGSAASAAVFERDWKAPGDGLLTYDDVNRREWLDLSVSRLGQFPAPQLQNAIAQIAPGGMFDGFTFAKGADVTGLAQSAEIDVSTRDPSINEVPTTELIRLLGRTIQTPVTIRSVGYIDETIPPSLWTSAAADFYVVYSAFGDQAGVFVPTADDFVGAASNGLMLYRDVPEPPTFVSALSCMCVLAHARMRGGFRDREEGNS